MIRAKHAAIIRKAIGHARANHAQAKLTAALARAYQWPAPVAAHATGLAMQPDPHEATTELYRKAYDRALTKQGRIKVHHPGCKCGHQPES